MSFLAVDCQKTSLVGYSVLAPFLERLSCPSVVRLLQVPYSGEKLVFWVRDPHGKQLQLKGWLLKTSVEMYCAGGMTDDCPVLHDMPCLFPPYVAELPIRVSTGSDLDGQGPHLPPLADESVVFFSCCCCCCCCCCNFVFGTCVTSKALA